MPPNLGSERATVQDPLIRYAVEVGWIYLSPEQALTLRRGESGTLLYSTLRDKLIELNPAIVTTDSVDQIIAKTVWSRIDQSRKIGPRTQCRLLSISSLSG